MKSVLEIFNKKLFLILIILFFVFVYQSQKVVAADTCYGGVSDCASPGTCYVEGDIGGTLYKYSYVGYVDYGGDAACSGSWNQSGMSCWGGLCITTYYCANCVGRGSTVTARSCTESRICSYNFGSFCNYPIGSCTTISIFPQGGSPEDPNIVSPQPGSFNTCSNTNHIPLFTNYYGYPSTSYVSQGDVGWLYGEIGSDSETAFNLSVIGCPPGAVCSFFYGNTIISPDLDYDPAASIFLRIDNTQAIPPGSYEIIIRLINVGDDACAGQIVRTLIVEPSRQTVCDGNWYTIAGSQVSPYNPVGKFFHVGMPSGGNSISVFAVGNDYQPKEQYCTGMTSSQSCVWNGLAGSGWNSMGSLSGLNAMAISPSDTWTRAAYARSGSGNKYRIWGVPGSWSITSDDPVWGSPTNTSDPYGRNYEFRRGSGGVVEYSCIEVKPNLVIENPSISPTSPLTGSNTIFTATVRNTGSAGAPSSNTRLRIDLNNDGSWDTIVGSQSTGALAISASEIENWNWTAVSGTHKYEICADSTNVVVESNESDNCFVSAPFTVTDPVVSVDVIATPSSVSSGNSSVITWSTSNATSCQMTCTSGSCNWTELNNSGSPLRSTGPLSSPRTYTLTCQPGNVADSVTINIVSNPILNVIKSGRGTVTSVPSGINCGNDCSEAYPSGSTVTLTAVPDSGRIFTGWQVQGGGICSGRGTCTVSMNGDKTVIASFAIDPNYKEF